MSVRPTLIPRNTLLANISDVFNGVLVEGDTVGQTLFYGRGAGRNATASAVVADLTDVAINLAVGSVRRIPAFRPGKLSLGIRYSIARELRHSQIETGFGFSNGL